VKFELQRMTTLTVLSRPHVKWVFVRRKVGGKAADNNVLNHMFFRQLRRHGLAGTAVNTAIVKVSLHG
jgi:hypothetical protein